jgi:bacteriorhodopsin
MKILKLLWLVVAVAVLGIALYGFDGSPTSDIEEVLLWAMLALSFPASLAVALLGAGLIEIASAMGWGPVGTSYPTLLGLWAVFAAAGYLQWFVFLPWLVARVRSRRTESEQKVAKA